MLVWVSSPTWEQSWQCMVWCLFSERTSWVHDLMFLNQPQTPCRKLNLPELQSLCSLLMLQWWKYIERLFTSSSHQLLSGQSFWPYFSVSYYHKFHHHNQWVFQCKSSHYILPYLCSREAGRDKISHLETALYIGEQNASQKASPPSSLPFTPPWMEIGHVSSPKPLAAKANSFMVPWLRPNTVHSLGLWGWESSFLLNISKCIHFLSLL